MNKVIGMLLWMIVFSIGSGSFSFACANESNQAKTISYKVKKGNMLRLISLKYYGTELKARFLAQANGIKNPDLIITGSTIKIPSINKKGNFRKLKLSRNDFKKNQSKRIETARKVIAVKAVIENYDAALTKQVSIVISQPVSIGDVGSKKIDAPSSAEAEIKEQVPAALSEKENSVSTIVPITEDKSKLAEIAKEPMLKSVLEFTSNDVMPENAPNAREPGSHMHSASNSDALEHQLSINTLYSKNKSDRMVGGMLDYMAWIKTPKLGENYSLGAGVFTSAWEDKISNAHIRGVMPGAQIGLKYNRHTDDHLMRMVYGKLMIGREFQSVNKKVSSVPIVVADPMTTDEAMNLNASVDSMNQAMPINSRNNFRLGSMLGLHYQLNSKSTLELMNENWLSLGEKASMEMDPAFSLIASHVYTSGDWSWRLGIGPQYEDWSKTWRLHVVPAEITYKEMVTLGVFSDLYLWKKREMYSEFNTQDLNSIGAALHFNIGTSMHKGHEVNND
jgi:hypothetical protein